MSQQLKVCSDGKNQYAIRTLPKVKGTIPPGRYDVYFDDYGIPHFSLERITSDDLYNFPNSPTDLVMAEIENFWEKAPVYKKHNLIHKRGILLFGVPGTGKTSIINQVSERAIEAGCIVMEFDGDCTGALKVIRDVQPNQRFLVVLEDLDKYCGNRGYEEALLNFLDGSAQIDNVSFLSTTNYLDRVPDRFKKRPSRFDTLLEVGLPNESLRAAYLGKLFGAEFESAVQHAAKVTGGLTFAHLKEYFIATHILGADERVTLERLGAVAMVEETRQDKLLGEVRARTSQLLPIGG